MSQRSLCSFSTMHHRLDAFSAGSRQPTSDPGCRPPRSDGGPVPAAAGARLCAAHRRRLPAAPPRAGGEHSVVTCTINMFVIGCCFRMCSASGHCIPVSAEGTLLKHCLQLATALAQSREHAAWRTTMMPSPNERGGCLCGNRAASGTGCCGAACCTRTTCTSTTTWRPSCGRRACPPPLKCRINKCIRPTYLCATSWHPSMEGLPFCVHPVLVTQELLKDDMHLQ